MVSFLINHNADINIKNSDGDTPLHYGSRLGSYGVLRLFQIFFWCVTLSNQLGREAAVALLVANGADVKALNNENKTPCDVVGSEGW